MATTINEVRALANREYVMEGARNAAEDAWREAWWDTTMALAAVEGGDGLVALALDAAARELGQTTNWLQRRRSTGMRVDLARLARSKIITLPPRLTVEWRGDIDADALLAAERDGVSIRDLARQQGTQVPSWQREDERTAPEPTPERRVEIAREEVARDPSIIMRALREDPATELEVVRDVHIRGAERMRAAGIRPNEELDAEEAPTIAATTAVALMQGVQRSLRSAIVAVRDAQLEPEDQAILLGYRDSTERLLQAFGQALTGDIDAELAELLKDQS